MATQNKLQLDDPTLVGFQNFFHFLSNLCLKRWNTFCTTKAYLIFIFSQWCKSASCEPSNHRYTPKCLSLQWKNTHFQRLHVCYHGIFLNTRQFFLLPWISYCQCLLYTKKNDCCQFTPTIICLPILFLCTLLSINKYPSTNNWHFSFFCKI